MWRRANPQRTDGAVHCPASELPWGEPPCLRHPAGMEASGTNTRMGNKVERRTNNDKHRDKHVDKDAHGRGVVSREDEVGLRFYKRFFQADFCFGRSVSGARLTALGARLHTPCLERLVLIFINAAVLTDWISLSCSRNYSGYCQPQFLFKAVFRFCNIISPHRYMLLWLPNHLHRCVWL